MDRFPVYTLDSAPEASKPALRDVQARFGMIPNLAGAMATSPVLIQSFIGIFDKVHGGSFTEPQTRSGELSMRPVADPEALHYDPLLLILRPTTSRSDLHYL
jgi:hypothetical protein